MRSQHECMKWLCAESEYQRWVWTARSRQRRHICGYSRWLQRRRVRFSRRTCSRCRNFPLPKNWSDYMRQGAWRPSGASRRNVEWSRNNGDGVRRQRNWAARRRRNRACSIGERRPLRRWSWAKRKWKCYPVGNRMRRRREQDITERIRWCNRWTSSVATYDRHRMRDVGMRCICWRRIFKNCSKCTGLSPNHVTRRPWILLTFDVGYLGS